MTGARACGREPQAVNMLVARNADVNAAASNGTTPLHWAAARNQYDIVRLLLLEGSNSAQRAGDGRTALHWACSNGHLEVVKVCARHRFNPWGGHI